MNQRLPLPGIERHPDLAERLQMELRQAEKTCQRTKILRRYGELMADRDATQRKLALPGRAR